MIARADLHRLPIQLPAGASLASLFDAFRLSSDQKM
jgi:hypothetical protein